MTNRQFCEWHQFGFKPCSVHRSEQMTTRLGRGRGRVKRTMPSVVRSIAIIDLRLAGTSRCLVWLRSFARRADSFAGSSLIAVSPVVSHARRVKAQRLDGSASKGFSVGSGGGGTEAVVLLLLRLQLLARKKSRLRRGTRGALERKVIADSLHQRRGALRRPEGPESLL
jgi:hypothetical protein